MSSYLSKEIRFMEINNSKEPIRLFKSDFLEFFSHINPIVVLIIYVPVLSFFLARSFVFNGGTVYQIPAGFVLGLVIWTLTEYLLHRFVFHFTPRNPAQERISFLFHGVHHTQPMSKTRLVMPPAVSIPLAIIFYLLFLFVIGVLFAGYRWVAPTFAGFTAGYIVYDMLHYSMHHFQLKNGYLLLVRKHHMQHHAKTPNMRFGVSSPFWDYIFGTQPKE